MGADLSRVCDELRKRGKKELPKYNYPDSVLTAARLQYFAAHSTDYRVRRGECCKISSLDSQRAKGKAIFGGGLLLSERAAAERAAAYIWTISDREREMQRMLGSATCDASLIPKPWKKAL